jgi:ribulose-phosphate 3-epimerase
MEELEMIFLLAVNPGWGGQKFIDSTRSRLGQVKQMILDSDRDILLGVDGGVTRDNIGNVAGMGVDIIVTGSAVFDGKTSAAKNAKFMLDKTAEAKIRRGQPAQRVC